MFALLDYDNITVIGYTLPDEPIENIIKEANGRQIIKMTPDNSPGYFPGYYLNKKFYQGIYEGDI
jgi:hypothetical protein